MKKILYVAKGNGWREFAKEHNACFLNEDLAFALAEQKNLFETPEKNHQYAESNVHFEANEYMNEKKPCILIELGDSEQVYWNDDDYKRLAEHHGYSFKILKKEDKNA